MNGDSLGTSTMYECDVKVKLPGEGKIDQMACVYVIAGLNSQEIQSIRKVLKVQDAVESPAGMHNGGVADLFALRVINSDSYYSPVCVRNPDPEFSGSRVRED